MHPLIITELNIPKLLKVTLELPQMGYLETLEELNQEYPFKVMGAVSAEIELKKYYALKVEAPALLQLRRKHKLSDKLTFKGYLIDFHITFAVSNNADK